MAADEIALHDFREIKERHLSDQENVLLNILSEALQQKSPEAISAAAYEIDSLCPSLEDENAVRDFLWSTWDLMLSAADSPDTTQEIQEILVCIIEELVQKERGVVNVYGNDKCLWQDVPMLPIAFEAHCNDPTLDPEDFTLEGAERWRNINAFGARCLRSSLLAILHDAINAVSSALEYHVDDMTPCRVEAASEWIAHASKQLLWWARKNIGVVEVHPENVGNFFDVGPLYDGLPSMSLQRWGFWETRFEELAKEESGLNEETRNVAREAAQTMKTMEADVGHTLAKG